MKTFAHNLFKKSTVATLLAITLLLCYKPISAQENIQTAKNFELQNLTNDSYFNVKVLQLTLNTNAEPILHEKSLAHLQDFFLANPGVLMVEVKNQNTIRITAHRQSNNIESIPNIKVLKQLTDMGYNVTSMRCTYNPTMFFAAAPPRATIRNIAETPIIISTPSVLQNVADKKITTPPTAIVNNAAANIPPSTATPTEDCGGCGSVKLTQKALEKAATDEYGGKAINVDIGADGW